MNTKQILIVEDDETIAFGIQEALKREGYQVFTCTTVAQARQALQNPLGLILLDWNLPDGTGDTFLRDVKAKGDTPVIFLTVRDEEKDIVHGLDMGADDYIVKPFPLSVLLSRVKAVLRRVKPAEQPKDILSCGAIWVDLRRTTVYHQGQIIPLTPGEYRLLITLLENKNQTLTRAQLLNRLWDDEGNFVNDNTLTVTMKRLREKLGSPDHLKTIRGIGYRMEDPQ